MIPIFLASDENYAPYVATTIISILKNTKAPIGFRVLDGGISKSSKRKISSLHKNIEFIDMKKSNLERFPNIAHYSTNAFSRYFIPELKPNLSRVLYLDVDIIVKSDIEELFNQDLENYPLGVVLEDFFPKNAEHLKKIHPHGGNYFNSGILIMDLDYFRKNDITQKLIEKTIELENCLNCPDQDVLNIIFENNFKILDYKFNFMPEHLNLKNPVIIHYTGAKPWVDDEALCANDFWEIAKISPFYNRLLHNLQLPKLYKKLPSSEHIKYLQFLGGFRGLALNTALFLKTTCSKFRI